MDKVAELLKKYGPMLSGRLAKIYEGAYGATNMAARKAISRAQQPVMRLKGLYFDKGQYFYYLDSQYMKEKFCDSLYRAMSDNATYQAYLQAFKNQGGCISKLWLASYTASPVKPVKGHKLYDEVLRELRKINVVEELDENHWKLHDNFIEIQVSRMMAMENTKKMVIDDFCHWIGRNNLGAYGSGKGMDDRAEVANFQWACTIPSYTQPLYDEKQKRPGFIVADIVTGREADLRDIQFFIQKVSIVRNFNNVCAILPVLFVDSLSEEAFRALKDQKVVIGVIRNFFDKRYADLLGDLVNLYTNATAILRQNPDAIYDLFHKIGETTGRFNNTRGSLFEFMVGYYYQKMGCDYLEMNKLIYSDTGRYKELDVLVGRSGKIIVVECKAMGARLERDFVERWLNENIPFTREALTRIYKNRSYEFQLWSVGGFDEQALSLLEKAGASTKKYAIRHFDRDEMIQMARDGGVMPFVKMMKEHFSKEA